MIPRSKRLLLPTLLAASLFATLPALAQSCLDDLDAEQVQTMVDQCIEVSPATRPPCNGENPCELIVSEIVRGCAMLSGSDKPAFCADYEEQ
ncbi:MAG: hypothetical protein AB7S80_10275 [Rhizobiaceae bacterium]